MSPRTSDYRVSVVRMTGVVVASLTFVVPAAPAQVRKDARAVESLPVVSPAGSPLADAAMAGDLPKVRALVARKVNVNVPQGDGMTALHWAAERGNLAMTELLLGAGARPTGTSRIGAFTPLHIASRNGHAPVVKALLRAGSKPNVATGDGATALHFAAASGSAAAISALLASGGDANARESEWGQTPLMFAAAANRSDAIAVLLKHQANPSILTKTVNLAEQATREREAARKRNEVLRSFLPQHVRDSLAAAAAAGAAAAPQAGGRGAAAQAARATVATTAGTNAAVATTQTPPAATPAGAAGGRGGNETPPTHYLTATQIQEAIAAGRETLLAPKVGPITLSTDTTDGQVAGFEGTVGPMGGMSALHHAVRQGNAEAAMALLDGGADINQRTVGDSTTPLLMATINGQFDVAMELVKRGANVKAASTAGATPLYSALNTQWSPRSRFPQPQSVQNQRTTHLELMQALITAGADINVRLKKNLWYFGYNNCGNANCGLEYLDGTTPFWRATYAVDVEAMRLLKAHGADATIPSFRAPAARGGRGGGGGRGDAGGAPAGTAADSALRARFAAGRGGQGAAAGGDAAGGRGARQGGGGGAGGPDGPGGPGGMAVDPATDSAARAVPPGIGVYPIHAAAGVGYGNGFAGNSHRHAPDGWMPSLKYLVEELGADVNQRDQNGYTPLHHAAARGDNEMIKYLVSKGADVKAVARNGRTTVDMANGPVQRLRPYLDTVALLEKLGAKNSHRCVSC